MCLCVTVFETSWNAQPNITLFALWIQRLFFVRAWRTTQSILVAVIVGKCWWLLSSRQPIFLQKLMAYFQFLGCMAAVQQVLAYLSQLSVWSLCETLRTTGLQENVVVQNCEVKEMKEQFLHPFPCTATDRVAVCDSVTVAHMFILILHRGQLQDVPTVTTKVNRLLVDHEYLSACAGHVCPPKLLPSCHRLSSLSCRPISFSVPCFWRWVAFLYSLV